MTNKDALEEKKQWILNRRREIARNHEPDEDSNEDSEDTESTGGSGDETSNEDEDDELSS